MKPALLGGLALSVAAAAMIAIPRPSAPGAAAASVASVDDGQERPVRPNRPVAFELSVSHPMVGRRPLGAASLVTRGQASRGFVTVGGFVRQPGRVAFEDGDTLKSVILKAEGPNEFGSMRRVKLIRDGKSFQFDLSRKESAPVPLKSGDMVEVPQKTLFGR